jgi:cullin-4
MIGKLKQECGAQFTAKLEGMFKDVELSKDVNNSTPTTTATYVNVLTAGLWPTYPNNSTLVLPVELERAKATFTEYYLSKHGGRKLAWVNGMGTCVLKARFGTHEKELVTCVLGLSQIPASLFTAPGPVHYVP